VASKKQQPEIYKISTENNQGSLDLEWQDFKPHTLTSREKVFPESFVTSSDLEKTANSTALIIGC